MQIYLHKSDQKCYLPATYRLGFFRANLCHIKEHIKHKFNSIAICMRFRNIMGPADCPTRDTPGSFRANILAQVPVPKAWGGF